MTLGEQTRQYQATLEAARRTRSVWGEILSGHDQINEANEQVTTASDHLWVAWANHRLGDTR